MKLTMQNIRMTYRIVMLLLAACATIDVYRLFNPHVSNIIFTIILFLSPLILIAYLLLILKYRKSLKRKLHDQQQKLFSKN